jgi:hypothetical protein
MNTQPCPPSRVKRNSQIEAAKSGFDPSATIAASNRWRQLGFIEVLRNNYT